MLSLSHQFLSFARSKPCDERYSFLDPQGCAFYQFATANGIQDPVRYDGGVPLPPLIAEVAQGFSDLDRADRWTFGRLAYRLEQALAEQVAL